MLVHLGSHQRRIHVDISPHSRDLCRWLRVWWWFVVHQRRPLLLCTLISKESRLLLSNRLPALCPLLRPNRLCECRRCSAHRSKTKLRVDIIVVVVRLQDIRWLRALEERHLAGPLRTRTSVAGYRFVVQQSLPNSTSPIFRGN